MIPLLRLDPGVFQGCEPGGQGPAVDSLVDGPARERLRQKCRAPGEGGGGQATDQAPETRRPNAAQSVVPGGLRAHTRETASPFPWGGGGPCRKWSRRSASPPIPCPWEGIRLRVGRVHARGAGQGTRGGDEEESRRHDA